MSKKKGLGQDVEKSLAIIEDLIKALTTFYNRPIKRGLKSNGTYDDDLAKQVTEAKKKASELHLVLDDLPDMIKGAKPKSSSRFACHRVISKFLEAR
jgi:hypothetical protein